LEAFRSRKIIIQPKVSAVICELLEVSPNHRVIDLSAAPGMKSTILSGLLARSGMLVCNDISAKRLAVLRRMMGKARLNCQTLVIADAAGRNSLPFRTGSFDRVLVDAPCSGSGIYGKYPDQRWKNLKAIPEFRATQRLMLEEGVRLLSPGGLGVYSVCSVHSGEGEEVIDGLLDRICLKDIWYGRKNSCFTKSVDGRQFNDDIGRYCRRTFPHKDGVEGFFIAKFGRR
jgi:16S rRNA C967 or C1407 C5-methylase (RsmB/RsmF family)